VIERRYRLDEYLQQQKVLILYGPRRVGKTTLLEQFLKDCPHKYKLDSGDNLRTQDVLGSQDFPRILEYAEGYELLVLDEAQQIPNIGMGLKILVDQRPDLKIIATGSSSFDLSHQVGEPLTGRKRTLRLYPVSQSELLAHHNRFELKELMESFLIFGSYPEVLLEKNRNVRIEILEDLVNSYIFKDILALERVKGAKPLLDLLKLLAFQLGSEVSLSELSSQIHMDIKTVDRYLDLLEKSFVIVRLGGLSRNLRKEVAKKQKYYFIDNGVRNAVISQFNSLDLRNDVGALWENFLMVERLKHRTYQSIYGSSYFWRTYDKQEIDLVEERDGQFHAYEIKWSTRKNVKVPKGWQTAYPKSTFSVVSPENYLDFVT
jgi:uncharacterized protein